MKCDKWLSFYRVWLLQTLPVCTVTNWQFVYLMEKYEYAEAKWIENKMKFQLSEFIFSMGFCTNHALFCVPLLFGYPICFKPMAIQTESKYIVSVLGHALCIEMENIYNGWHF